MTDTAAQKYAPHTSAPPTAVPAPSPTPAPAPTPTYDRVAGSSETGFDEPKPKRGRKPADASKPTRTQVLAALRAFDPEAPAQQSAAEKERARLVAQATTATRALVKTLEGLGIADSSDTASAAGALMALASALKKSISALEGIPDSKLNLVETAEEAAAKERKPRGRPKKVAIAEQEIPPMPKPELNPETGAFVERAASTAVAVNEPAVRAPARRAARPAPVRRPRRPARPPPSRTTTKASNRNTETTPRG